MQLVIIESPFAGGDTGKRITRKTSSDPFSGDAVFQAVASQGDFTACSDLKMFPHEAEKQANRRLSEKYARAAMRDCLQRGEAPYASHLLYTQPGVLDDDKPDERELGIEAGLQWGAVALKTVVYTDLGISEGMWQGIERAEAEGRPIECRTLPGWS